VLPGFPLPNAPSFRQVHWQLAKDLTAGQPALCHHSPFSKLTAPPDEPTSSVERGHEQGAVFTVELAAIPFIPVPEAPVQAPASEVEPERRILLVDDHVDTLRTTAAILKKWGDLRSVLHRIASDAA